MNGTRTWLTSRGMRCMVVVHLSAQGDVEVNANSSNIL